MAEETIASLPKSVCKWLIWLSNQKKNKECMFWLVYDAHVCET